MSTQPLGIRSRSMQFKSWVPSKSFRLANWLRLAKLLVFARLAFECATLPAENPDGLADGLVHQESSIQGIRFRYPIDAVLELVASSPMVQWPIVADWDAQGRLLVLESAGISGNAEEQTKTRPHRMIRLEDVDGDGDFDRRTVVAENLGFPEGVLAIDHRVLVSTPQQILALIDDHRESLDEAREI